MTISFTQTQDLSVNQQWLIQFQDASSWTVSLNQATADGFQAKAVSPDFGAELEALVAVLDSEDKALLELSGNYLGFLVAYPAGVVSASGSDLLLCSVTEGNFSTGQGFGLKQSVNGLTVQAKTVCSVSLVTQESMAGWPPSVAAGERWQVSVSQAGVEVSAWTLSFSGQQATGLVGLASGTDDRQVEASFITENPPQPNLLDTWVFALSNGSNPLFCVFSKEKPFTDVSMTGSVLFAEATCNATKLE